MKNHILSLLFVCFMLTFHDALCMSPAVAQDPKTPTPPDSPKTPLLIRPDMVWPVVISRESVDWRYPISFEEIRLLQDIERDKKDIVLLTRHAKTAIAHCWTDALTDLLHQEHFRPYLTNPNNMLGLQKLFAMAAYLGYQEGCQLLLPVITTITQETFNALLHGKLFTIAERFISRFKLEEFHGIMNEALQDTLADKNQEACDFILSRLSLQQTRIMLTDRNIFGLAAENGNRALVQLCLTYDIEPNVPVFGEETWRTALYCAAKESQAEVCKILVASGAKRFDCWDPEINGFVVKMFDYSDSKISKISEIVVNREVVKKSPEKSSKCCSCILC